MEISENIKKFLQTETNYFYTGWQSNDITEASFHVEWCKINIKNLCIIIRQDNYGPYKMSIYLDGYENIKENDKYGLQTYIFRGVLDDSLKTKDLISFLKVLSPMPNTHIAND